MASPADPAARPADISSKAGPAASPSPSGEGRGGGLILSGWLRTAPPRPNPPLKGRGTASAPE